MKIRLLVSFLCLFLSSALRAEWHAFSYEVMTTSLNIELDCESESLAKTIADDVYLEFVRVEKVLSRHKPESELSLVNQKASLIPIKISSELFSVLKSSIHISQLTSGAFDITFGSVGYLYDYRQQRMPDRDVIDATLDRIDYRLIELNQDSMTVFFKKHGVRIDLGGIGKGYAIDLAIDILKSKGITNARVQAGGDMYLLGRKGDRSWHVAIQNPRKKESSVAVLALEDEAISTSGDYQRFFIASDGERIHHILSPKTGKPVKGIRSVSVVGKSALYTDGLSTAIFVLGKDKGMSMVDSLDKIEAVIVDESNQILLSKGLKIPEL